MDYMAESKKNYSEVPEPVENRIKQRENKRKPKMKVSGKRVFQLKQIKQRAKPKI